MTQQIFKKKKKNQYLIDKGVVNFVNISMVIHNICIMIRVFFFFL